MHLVVPILAQSSLFHLLPPEPPSSDHHISDHHRLTAPSLKLSTTNAMSDEGDEGDRTR